MLRLLTIIFFIAQVACPARSIAQTVSDALFIQVSSHATKESAERQAKKQLAWFPDVAVYQTTAGTFAVVIASVPAQEATATLNLLKANKLVVAAATALPQAFYHGLVWSNVGGKQVATKETVAAAQVEGGWTKDVRRGVQNALVWSGDYVSRIDGDFGPATRRAIKSFQLSLGNAPTGYLTSGEVAKLESLRKTRVEYAGFRVYVDMDAGIRIGLPTTLFQPGLAVVDDSGLFKRYQPTGALTGGHLTLISHTNYGGELRPLFELIRGFDEFPYDAYSAFRDDWFVVSGGSKGVSGYAYVRQFGHETKGFLLTWPDDEEWIFGPISVAMFDSLDNIPGRNLERFKAEPPNHRPTGEGADYAANPPEPKIAEPGGSAGTGFFISADGYLVTNQHVIDSCTRNLTAGGYRAVVVVEDEARDLAVLKTTSVANTQYARFAAKPIPLNSDVTVAGFPLPGLLQGLNVTRGAVSGMFGFRGSVSGIQITAPIQPGNSGGPVLEESGLVVGVVQSKLSPVAFSNEDIEVPQNVNFAIRGESVQTFLSQNSIGFEVMPSGDALSPVALAANAREFTVQVLCD